MKTVHWQIYFWNIQDTHRYRVNIYAEGAVTAPVILTGAKNPFVEQKDSDNEIFAPMRGSTASITIVNDQGELLVPDLLPSGDLDRPVNVWDMTDNRVVWQGFLTAECYTQSYVSRPSEITLNAISTLTALRHVRIDVPQSNVLVTIRSAVYDVFHKLEEAAGILNFRDIYYPVSSWRILTNRIDLTLFNEVKEVDNEENVEYVNVGSTADKLIEYLCTLMSWVCCEDGEDIYLQDTSTHTKYYTMRFREFGRDDGTWPHTIVDQIVTTLDDDAFMGTNHTISVNAPAKSVEVVASMKRNVLNMTIPEMSVGNTKRTLVNVGEYQKGAKTHYDYVFLTANMSSRSYSNLRLRYSIVEATYDPTIGLISYGDWTPADSEEDIRSRLAAVSVRGSRAYNVLSNPGAQRLLGTGAFLARASFETYESREDARNVKHHEWQNGLYCAMAPAERRTDYSDILPVAQFVAKDTFSSVRGYLVLKANFRYLAYLYGYFTYQTGAYMDVEQSNELVFRLKYGDKYWNGQYWTQKKSAFVVETKDGEIVSNWDESFETDEDSGHFIPTDGFMGGEVVLELLPFTKALFVAPVFEMFFTNISLEHKPKDYEILTDRTENHYYTLIDERHKDEMSVECNLCTLLHNDHSQSMVMMDGSSELTRLEYADQNGVPYYAKPERYLLDKYIKHYSMPQERINVEYEHIEQQPLTVLEYDGKKYLALSETRDYRLGVSTITLFSCIT